MIRIKSRSRSRFKQDKAPPAGIKRNNSVTIAKNSPQKRDIRIDIRIERTEGKYFIFQQNKQIAQFREELKINMEAFAIFKQMNAQKESHIRFEPPEFGVTTLGTLL